MSCLDCHEFRFIIHNINNVNFKLLLRILLSVSYDTSLQTVLIVKEKINICQKFCKNHCVISYSRIARGLLLAEGPPHWGGGKESESWSHEKSMLAVLVQILLKSCFENGKLWETKKVSAREKTKQPIAGPVLMSFCSTNWN